MQSALTVLAVAVAMGIVPFVGPVAAGLIVFLIFGAIAAALMWVGWSRLREICEAGAALRLAARAEVEIARKRMLETLGELQQQFAPRALVREAWE